jgi:GTP-binding protein Era
MKKQFLQVAISGIPNAGKSTLVNHFVGCQVGIISPKPQTTRHSVKGILTENEKQIVFIDTPGAIKKRSSILEKKIAKEAWNSFYEADLVCILIDGTKGITQDDKTMVENAKKESIPVVFVINKSDLIKFEHKFLLAEKLNELYPESEIFSLSAKNGNGCTALLDYIKSKTHEGEWLFDKDSFTNQDSKTIAAEVVREQIFNFTNQELPYAVHCETEFFSENDEQIQASVIVFATKANHKKIILGKNGSMIRKIIANAATKLEEILGKKVQLKIFIKIDDKWQLKYL